MQAYKAEYDNLGHPKKQTVENAAQLKQENSKDDLMPLTVFQ